MSKFKIGDVVSLMIKYGDYSHVRNGIIVKIEEPRFLVEYIFWGPYDEDPQKYLQWCQEEELTLEEDPEKVESIKEDHSTFKGHTNSPV